MPHPLGVLPTGNALLIKDAYRVRRNGLGLLNIISDEAVLELLSYFNGEELVKMLKLSRAFYVYCNYSDLWRDLTLKTFTQIDFLCTWKDTYLSMKMKTLQNNTNTANTEKTYTPYKPIKITNMFSNILHRSWVCHTCNFKYACPGFYNKCDIARINANEIDCETFIKDYESVNKPVIIQNSAANWSSMKNWNQNYLGIFLQFYVLYYYSTYRTYRSVHI